MTCAAGSGADQADAALLGLCTHAGMDARRAGDTQQVGRP